MILELDENGVPIDFLADRNAEMLQNLETPLEQIVGLQSDKRGAIKLGNMVTNAIFAELERYPLLTAKEFNNLDAETLQYYFQKYLEFINNFIVYEISTTKPLFCQYMRITVEDFLNLLNNSTDDALKRYAKHIDDVISGLAFSQAETGNSNSNAVLKRAKIKDVGQNMVETAPDTTLFVEQAEDPELALARLRETRQLMAERLAALKQKK